MMRFLGIIFLTIVSLSAEVVEESVSHAGVKFRVVRLEPKQVRITWKDEGGVPYRRAICSA